MFAPEGTRNGDGTWRTGFYHTAVASNLPIALGYLDYDKRRGGVASFFKPTGNLEKDIELIRSFYEPIKRRNI
jgi:1-acyl-sn-glycerol-3-phosphate acyltransferase